MKVISLTPAARPGDGSLRLLATFDLALSDQIRLYGLRLLEAPGGRRIVYAAQSGSRRTATFDPLLAERITILASTTYDEATTAHGATSKT